MSDEQKVQAEKMSEVAEEQLVKDAAEETVAEAPAEDVTEEQAEPEAGEVMQQELENALSELDKARDQVLRAQADMQNVRRRAQLDVEKAHKFSVEKFAKDMLPVVDSLDRALETIPADDENVKAMREGIEMTLNLFIDSLKKHGVEAINPVGEPFDPQKHEAMSMLPNPDMEPNTVMNVFQKGFLLNGRLVRPAMVVVSS
ncbi:nucleotide exchange factor GrpE [Endozoicomonadaceae bacterium StTr2]